MGDVADLVAAGTAIATVLDSNVARAMPEHAHAIPRDADRETLRGWAGPQEIGWRWHGTTPMSRAGISSDNLFDITVAWQYGAHERGRGLYIKDAHVYVEVTSVGLGHSFTATAKFNEVPSWEGAEDNPIAVLGGECDIMHEYWSMTENSVHLEFEIKGDGSGRIWN